MYMFSNYSFHIHIVVLVKRCHLANFQTFHGGDPVSNIRITKLILMLLKRLMLSLTNLDRLFRLKFMVTYVSDRISMKIIIFLLILYVLFQIDCVVKLSGMPDLSMSFMNPRMFDDTSFHPCVRFKRWEVCNCSNYHTFLKENILEEFINAFLFSFSKNSLRGSCHLSHLTEILD